MTLSRCTFRRQVAKTKGKIHAEYSIKYAAVIMIFLLSGAGLKTRVLLDAAAAWRIHLARLPASRPRYASSALTPPSTLCSCTAVDADAIAGRHSRHRIWHRAWALENIAEQGSGGGPGGVPGHQHDGQHQRGVHQSRGRERGACAGECRGGELGWHLSDARLADGVFVGLGTRAVRPGDQAAGHHRRCAADSGQYMPVHRTSRSGRGAEARQLLEGGQLHDPAAGVGHLQQHVRQTRHGAAHLLHEPLLPAEPLVSCFLPRSIRGR